MIIDLSESEKVIKYMSLCPSKLTLVTLTLKLISYAKIGIK